MNMPEGICSKCHKKWYGWSMVYPTDRLACEAIYNGVKCGGKIVVSEREEEREEVMVKQIFLR